MNSKTWFNKISITALSLTILGHLALAATSFASSESKAKSSFSDIKGHWAENLIETAVQIGLVQGYSDSRFAPNDKVSKEAFITLATRTTGIDPQRDSSIPSYTPFIDVENQRWSAPFIKWAVQNGLVEQQKYNGYYMPTEAITREEAATIIKRTLLYSLDIPKSKIGKTTVFNDDEIITTEHKEDVYFLRSLGIMDGSDNEFRPLRSLTRAEATVLLLRVLDAKSNLSSYSKKTIPAKVSYTKPLPAQGAINNYNFEFNGGSCGCGTITITYTRNGIKKTAEKSGTATQFEDMDGDGIKEIIDAHIFSWGGGLAHVEMPYWVDIYKFDPIKEKFILESEKYPNYYRDTFIPKNEETLAERIDTDSGKAIYAYMIQLARDLVAGTFVPFEGMNYEELKNTNS